MTDPLAWLTDLDGVLSAYAGTRDGIDVMLRDRGLRKTTPDVAAESLLRGAGASAVQLYSALVYEGPGLARRINAGLAERLRAEKFGSIAEAVGRG